MQTSDLNVNKTESDHATAIFRQFQDAIFSREHISVKTSTKIIFDLLQWQEIATLSPPKKAAIASLISTIFRGHFWLRANDIARNRSRAIFCRACVDIFRRCSFSACGTVAFFLLPHCIYGEFFGLFESFSPVQTKTPKQLKYDALHHRFQKPPSRPFTRKRYAGVFKNSTLGTFFKARKYRLRVDGKLNGEKKSVPFQKIPGYVWTRRNLR